MAELKVTLGIDAEITALNDAGKALNDGHSASDGSGVNTLSTAKAYLEQERKIKALLDLYAKLVQKDAADLNAMVQTVRAADQAASGSYSG